MPGMFSRYGVFGNPLADLLGAATIGEEVMRGRAAATQREMAPDEETLRFLNAQAADPSGGLVSQIPRPQGFFTRMGEGLGLIDPNLTARPKDLYYERGQQAEEMKSRIADIKELSALHGAEGTANFAMFAQTPLGRQMLAETGAPPEQAMQMFAQKTPQEQEQDMMKDRIKLQEIDAEIAFKRLQWEMGKPQPNTPEYFEMKKHEREVEAEGSVTGFQRAVGGNWANEDAKLKVARFDRNTWDPIDRTKFPNPAAADADPNVVKYPLTYAPTVNAARQYRKIANEAIAFIGNSDVLVDRRTYGKNDFALKAAVKANQLKIDHWSKIAGDPVTLKAYVGQLTNLLQQLQPHVRTSLKTMENVQAGLPFYPTDTKQDAIDKLRRSISDVGQGIGATSRAEDAEYMASEARAFLVEEELATPPTPAVPSAPPTP